MWKARGKSCSLTLALIFTLMLPVMLFLSPDGQKNKQITSKANHRCFPSFVAALFRSSGPGGRERASSGLKDLSTEVKKKFASLLG